MISPGRAHRLALTLATVLLVGGCINQPSLPSSGSSATLDDRPPGEPQLPVTAQCAELQQNPTSVRARVQRVNATAAGHQPSLPDRRPGDQPGPAVQAADGGQSVGHLVPALPRGDAVLQAAQKRYGARVQFVGVNTKDHPDWAAEFVQEVNVTYPQVVDFDGELLASVRSPGLPVTLVLDGQGEIAGRKIGRISEELLTDLVDKVG
jgi:hypothetical protein